MASSHQHPLLQSSDLEYGSPTASLHFAAHSASGRLGQSGRLLELQIEGDGTCSIMPLEDSSTLYCPGLLSNLYCGTAPPDQIAAADIVGASTSGSELTIWHAPLDKRDADKPSRRMRQLALQLESEEAAAQAATHLRSTCCWQGYEGQEAPRLLVIVNPASGPGKGPRIYERQVLPALQAAGARLTMHITREPLHATAIVKGVAPGSVDCIVAIGGDGTMYEVLQGMLARPDWQPLAAIPFAQIPCGSGNALAASMGMWTWDTAVHAIVKGQQRALDVATVLQASPPRRCFSFLSINFGLITNLPRLDMNFHLAPDATADSGHFNLIYTPPASRRQGFELLSASEKGAHMHLVKQRRVAAMSLEPQSTGTWLVVDGEAMPYVPMYLEVHPSLCRAIVAPTAS